MRTVRRLRLRYLLFRTICVLLSTHLLFAQSITGAPPPKYTVYI